MMATDGTPPDGLPADEARAWRLALVVVLAAAAARLVLADLVPLFPDETYYWEWTRRPAASYFDHPPGVAATIAFGTAVFGDTRFGVRFGAVLLSLVGSLAVIAAARRVAGGRASLVAALALAVMPMAAAGLLLATPDAPLLAALAVAIWALLRAVDTEPGGLEEIIWWCVTGLALGAALLSKYTAILLPVGAALGFVLDSRLRPRILTPGPWVAVGLGIAAFAPVIVWNAQLGWPSFAFQLDHGLGAAEADAGPLVYLLEALSRLLEYIGGQLGLVSPILFALMAIVVVRVLRSGAKAERDQRLTVLAAIALVVFVTFAASSLRRHVEPNWPAPAYVAGVVLLAAAWQNVSRRWLGAGVWLGAALVAVIYVQALTPVLPVDARRDPVAEAHGWEDLAAFTEDARASLRDHDCEPWVATNRYQEASELAFHLPDRPTVFSLNVGRRSNQYALWPAFEDEASAGDCLVFVDIDGGAAARIVERLSADFRVAEEIGPTVRRRGRGVTANYRVWAFRDWTGKGILTGP